MRDGTKESTKELMATFRLVVGVSLSVLVLFANLQIRGFLRLTHAWAFYLGLGLAAASCLLCGWLFLLVVRMLHLEEEDIVYQLPVIVIGGMALLTFVASLGLLMVGQM